MLKKLIACFFILGSMSLIAAESDQPNLDRLHSALGGASPDSVQATAIPGLYEVVIGSQILYVSGDGQFVIQGDMIDLSAQTNLTEARRSELRTAAVEAVGEENMVIFAPDQPAAHTITVFTDIDCGYCRQFHRQISDYNQEGIKVRYLMFPRAGVGSDSYDKAVSVWCADDPKDAMTRAKRGETVEAKTCDNPVEAQYQLGQALGVRGTPSLVLETGDLVPGYVPPTQLAQMLEKSQ